MDKKLLYTLLTFASIILALYLIIYLLSPFLGAIVWAIVLAMATHPVYKWFLKLTKGKKNISSFLSTTVVFIVIAIPFFVLAIIFAGQAYDVFSYIEDSIQKGEIPILTTVQSNPQVSNIMEKLKPYLNKDDFHSFGLTLLKATGNVLAFSTKKLTINLFSALFQFFMTILILFFAFRDGETIVNSMWEIVPLKEQDKKKMVDILKKIIGAVLYGIVLACIAQGLLGGIGFYLAGIKAAVFYGAIMTLCAFIPMVGTAIVWIPAVIYLFFTGQYGKAIFLAIWCLTLVSLIDNVIRPLYISGKSKISLPIIVLGVLGGLITLGFLGIILGPIILSLFVEVVRIYKEEVVLGKTVQEEKTESS